MTTSKHLTIAGVLQLVQSIPLLLFSAYYIAEIILVLRDGSQELGELSEGIFMLSLFAVILLAEGAVVWFGIALIKQKQWTRRVGGFVCCVPGLLSMPIVISVYTLWALVQMNKDVTCNKG